MYIPLHGRSTYSFLEAIGTPKVLVKRAKELGFSMLALTDVDVMYGAIAFYQAARDEGIKPIIGAELGFVMDVASFPLSVNKKVGGLCLLAKNEQGYLNLMKLVSFAGEEGVMGRPKVDLAILEECKEGILLFAGGAESWIGTMVNNAEPIVRIQEIVESLQKIVGKENFYLEVIAQDESKHADIRDVNRAVLQISKNMDIPCIVSNIYRYPTPQDKQTQELGMAIKDNLKLYDPQHRVLTTQNHMMSELEIRKICSKNGYSSEQIDAWIANIEQVGNQCNVTIAMGQSLFPKYEVEPAIQELYNKYKDSLISE